MRVKAAKSRRDYNRCHDYRFSPTLIGSFSLYGGNTFIDQLAPPRIVLPSSVRPPPLASYTIFSPPSKVISCISLRLSSPSAAIVDVVFCVHNPLPCGALSAKTGTTSAFAFLPPKKEHVCFSL